MTTRSPSTTTGDRRGDQSRSIGCHRPRGYCRGDIARWAFDPACEIKRSIVKADFIDQGYSSDRSTLWVLFRTRRCETRRRRTTLRAFGHRSVRKTPIIWCRPSPSGMPGSLHERLYPGMMWCLRPGQTSGGSPGFSPVTLVPSSFEGRRRRPRAWRTEHRGHASRSPPRSTTSRVSGGGRPPTRDASDRARPGTNARDQARMVLQDLAKLGERT